MDNISDKLFINLRKLGKIEKNGKIARSYDGIISLEQNTFLQPLKRFLFGDSRKQSVFEINSVVNEAIHTLQSIINSRYMHQNFANTDEYIKNCEKMGLLLNEFEQARFGIENLKFTYMNDANIAPQLDIIILKIKSVIKDMKYKLKYYQNFLPKNYTILNDSQTHEPIHFDDVNNDEGDASEYNKNMIQLDSCDV